MSRSNDTADKLLKPHQHGSAAESARNKSLEEFFKEVPGQRGSSTATKGDAKSNVLLPEELRNSVLKSLLNSGIPADKSKGWIERINSPDKAEKEAGVHHSAIVHYAGEKENAAKFKLGLDSNGNLMRIDNGTNVYVNKGKSPDKPSWHMQKPDGSLQKMPFENYSFSAESGEFRSQITENHVRSWKIDGSQFDMHTMATGAKVTTDRYSNVVEIEYPNGSKINAEYENSGGRALTHIDGRRVDPEDKIRLEANGNIYTEKKNGEKTITRGDGTILNVSAGQPQYNFDLQGRITRITPPREAYDKGAKIRDYKYIGDSNELAAVTVTIKNPDSRLAASKPDLTFFHERSGKTDKWTCVDEYGRAYATAQGEHILHSGGEYAYKESIKQGNNTINVAHVCYPDGNEERQKAFQQTDGSQIVGILDANGSVGAIRLMDKNGKLGEKHELATGNGATRQLIQRAEDKSAAVCSYDNKGNLVGVQEINKSGKPGRALDIALHNGQPRITEHNVDGTTAVWDRNKDNGKWHGQLISAKDTNKDASTQLQSAKELPVREDLTFSDKGILAFKDESGAQHQKFKDGSELVKFVDQSYAVKDNAGRIAQAGPIIQLADGRSQIDTHNYLRYSYAGNEQSPARVEKVIANKSTTVWSNENKDQPGLLNPDGSFRHISATGDVIHENTDLTRAHWTIVRNEKGEPIKDAKGKAQTYLSEVTARDGSKRTFEYEKENNDFKLKRAVSVALDINGNANISVLDALPRTAQNPQEYNLSVFVRPSSFKDNPSLLLEKQTPIAQGKFFGLKVVSNGDIELSSTQPDLMGINQRFTFKTNEMSTSLMGRTEAPSSRLAKATARFNDLFEKQILPELRLSLPAQMNINGRMVEMKSIENDKVAMATLAENYVTRVLHMPPVGFAGQLPAGQLSANEGIDGMQRNAFRYELAAATAENALAMRRMAMANPSSPASKSTSRYTAKTPGNNGSNNASSNHSASTSSWNVISRVLPYPLSAVIRRAF